MTILFLWGIIILYSSCFWFQWSSMVLMLMNKQLWSDMLVFDWLFANSFMIILCCLIAWFIGVLMICFPATFVIADNYFYFGSLSYICIWFVWLLQVETIGDAYCVAAGLHRKSLCHAKPIALMALKMMELSEEVLTPDGRPIQVSFSTVLFE